MSAEETSTYSNGEDREPRAAGLPILTDEEVLARDLEREREAMRASLGEMEPDEYGRRRAALSVELETPLAWLDLAYKEQRAKVRASAAKEAPKFLDAPEPWPEPVDAAIIAELTATVRRHVVVSAPQALTIALWIIHTYALGCFNVTPTLLISSPEKRCGKTTLLGIIAALVRKGLSASNISPALAFRIVDRIEPTLLLDEADNFLTDEKSELRGILNSSHSRTSAYVYRCDGDDHEPRAFKTWCAKVYAMIGKPHPTLLDRSIKIGLERKPRNQSVERRRADRIDDLIVLSRRAARWAADHEIELSACDPTVPASAG